MEDSRLIDALEGVPVKRVSVQGKKIWVCGQCGVVVRGPRTADSHYCGGCGTRLKWPESAKK